MIELYSNIKKARLKKGLTQTELANRVGYTDRSIIAKIERGQVDLSQSKIEAIAKALDTTSIQLMGAGGIALKDNPFIYDNIYPIETKRFPLLGEIACGEPIYANEDRESYVIAGADIRADFCLRAKGDSMIGSRINDGDIVFIRKQDMVENGEIAAVIIEDEVTLKRVEYHKEKNILILKPDNPAYGNFVYIDSELDKIKILGKAIAFQSDL